MSQPNPPPLPTLAFSQKSEVVLNGELLSKGFITPKKEKEAHFFRRKSQSSINEQWKFNSSSPFAVEILVGSKVNIEQWLRESGPGTSCLWAEVEDSFQNVGAKVLTRQLKLIYRLHSKESLNFLPVLDGVVVEILPPIGSHKDGGGLRKAHKMMKTMKGEMKCSSFMMQPDTKSPSNISSNSAGDISPSIDTNAGLVENEKSIGLVISEKAYKHLVLMVSRGGIIWEFQQLLRRAVVNSNFLDVDYRLLDLQQWLKNHPFATFLKGNDILVVRRGDGLLGVQWIVLRFDFSEGHLKSTTGEGLDDLGKILRNNNICQVFGIQANWWGPSEILYGDKAQETQRTEVAENLVWKIWTMPFENVDCHGGPLTHLLLDALGGEERLSIIEKSSFKSLFDSLAQMDYHTLAEANVIETIFAFGRSKRMSWKEQCALSHLRSNSKELKGKGLQVLLNLLLATRSKTSLVTNPTLHGPLNVLCPRLVCSKFDNGYCCAIGEVDNCLWGEGAREVVLQEDDSQAKHGGEPLCVMDWLNCGFLEVLLDRTTLQDEEKNAGGMETSGVLDIELALETCLRVLELVPKEGSSQLAKVLVTSMQESYEDFLKLNVSLKQNGNHDFNMQTRSHNNGREGKPSNCAHTMQPNTKHSSPSLHDMFEKVLRVCKLLSLLESQSPLVGGPFAELGGLDLILDVYFCLVKRFPTNLRFGVLSKDIGICKSLEQNLPGETFKSQDRPLKVLPCILPRACISGVAHTCLMDHCMYPKTEKVDFAWPHTSNWKVLYPFNNSFDSLYNVTERSYYDILLDNSLGAYFGQMQDFDLLPKIPKVVESHKPNLSAQTVFTPELNHGHCNSSSIVSPIGNGYLDSPFAINHNNSDNNGVEDPAIFHKTKKTRPFVPLLPLSSLRRSTSRFGPSKAESQEAKALHTCSIEPNLCELSSNTRASTANFDILTVVFNAKCELLGTMIQLFSNCSHSLFVSRRKLLQKFQKEDEDYLALQFLPDIINSFLKTIPENLSKRTKKMLFEVISLLDRGKTPDGMKKTPSSQNGRTNEVPIMHFNIGLDIPFSTSKRLVDSLLLDIGEWLRTLLHHLANMLATSQSSTKETANNQKQLCVTMGAFEYCDPLLENCTISNGHLLNLWVDIGLLLGALVDFIVLWPEGGSVHCVLNSCGKELESVLSLLAEFSSKSEWSLAQIMTMEHLLRLLTVCIKNYVLEKSPEFQIWSNIDAFLWQLLFVNDLHWNCIKNFTTWVVMKSCQGCFKKSFETHQRVLWEPLEIYYNMFGERINYKSTIESSECPLHGVDMLKNIFSFLRVSILMMKKRLKCHSQINQSSPTLFMERLVFLLDFLMNPVHGILMNVIRSPIPSFRLNITHRELSTSTKRLENTSDCQEYNNLEHVQPTIDDNCFSHHVQESCRKCPSTLCVASCAHKFTSYLQKESLGILADIFSLNSSEHHDEQTNLYVHPRMQNPFLFWKYVNPFLEIVFFYFLKYYNKKIECNESSQISPLTLRISGHSPMSVNSGQRLCGYTRTIEGSSTHETFLQRNDKEGSFCSCCVQDDKVSSIACVTYGQVLRALAQNQSKDVNQSFQQMRVMKFLVQQIGLEYEMSQLVTPQEVALPVQGVTMELSELQELQGFEGETSKAGVLFTGERRKAPFPHNNEDIDPHQGIVEENDGRGQMEAVECGTFGNRLVPKESILSELFLSKECSTHLRDAQVSKTSLDQSELVADMGVPLAQLSDNKTLKKCSLKKLEVCSIQASSQSESEILGKSNTTLEESNIKIGLHTEQSGITIVNHLGNILAHSNIDQTGDGQGLNTDLLGGGPRELSASSILTEVKYTGRFFDLNEEVERELAQETFPHAEYYSQEVDKTAQITHFDLLKDIQEESNLQECDLKLSTFDPTQSRIGGSNKSSGSASFSEVRLHFTPKRNPRHPPIPRLNLSKSVRKGGPAFKSDTSLDFELLPSPTTLDSKSRPNAILELQKELQKELLSSNKSGRSWEIGASYETGCQQRRLYRHAGLHVMLLELFVSLMLTPQGTLETSYSDRYPMENRKLNAPFFLFYHLNHAANVHLLPCLSKRMKDFNPAAIRILKLTWRALFNPRIYTNRDHIARGAASQVYTAKVKRNCSEPDGVTDELVVLKVVDMPKGPYDPCKFFDVYSEVEILEKFSGEPAICQILDYGVDTESFILVLKHYKCSLNTWRQGPRGSSGNGGFSPTEIERVGEVPKFVVERLPVYLEVYSAILQAVKKLEIENVVHYDLKCDNILLEPLDESCLESEFWTLKWPPVDPAKPLPFRICIADFGQSKASTHLGGECTVRNRGTEYVKSPEMLKLLSSQSQRETDFNMRTIDEGVGKAVDVWSLGCLLYELLTGEYLFYDEDWLQFFMRVTLPSEELISEEKAAKLENYGPVVDLLKFILVRDPIQRPSLDEVTICVEQLQLKLEAQPLTTTGNGNEVAPKFQTVIESGSDSDESNLYEQMCSPEINSVRDRFKENNGLIDYNIPDTLKQKIHVNNSLESLRGLLCCKCGEGS